MAKYIYPAVFTPEDGGYVVNFPDFESCYTEGDTLEEAMEMADDVLCLTLYDLEETGKAIPEPSPIKAIRTDGDAFVSLVHCDTVEYRKYFDNRAVKKTLTIPNWLNTIAERQGVNFSLILQNALKKELNI